MPFIYMYVAMVSWLKTQFYAIHIGARGYIAIAKMSFYQKFCVTRAHAYTYIRIIQYTFRHVMFFISQAGHIISREI